MHRSTNGILVIEDDRAACRMIEKALRGFGNVRFAHSVAEARAEIASRSQWSAWIVDIDLPDGSGLDLVEELRGNWSRVEVMFLTGLQDLETQQRIFRQRAQYLPKPAPFEDLVPFVLRCRFADAKIRPRVMDSLERITREYKLSSAMAAILLLGVKGLSRAEILKARGVSSNTLKAQIAEITMRMQVRDFAQAVRVVFARALDTG